MKNCLFIVLIIVLAISFSFCVEKNDISVDVQGLIGKAEDMQKKLDKKPNVLTIRLSTAKAYQRVADYYYEREAYKNLKGLNLDYIESVNNSEENMEVKNSLIESLKNAEDYYSKAIDTLEENKFVYSFEGQKDRDLLIYHIDPEIQKIFNKEATELTKREEKIKKEWFQRLNPIMHNKLGLAYRALVPIYLANRNYADDEKKAVDYYKKAVEYAVKAEKQFKIASTADPDYKDPYLNLAKLYLYMYEKLQKETDTVINLNLASIQIENIFDINRKKEIRHNMNINFNELDALLIKARIYHQLGNYYKLKGDYHHNFKPPEEKKKAYNYYQSAMGYFNTALKTYEDRILSAKYKDKIKSDVELKNNIENNIKDINNKLNTIKNKNL